MTAKQAEEVGLNGPRLQVLMFDLAKSPNPVEATSFVERAHLTRPAA